MQQDKAKITADRSDNFRIESRLLRAKWWNFGTVPYNFDSV
jgi:hypothetical protein